MNKKLREELKIEKKLDKKSSNITISNIHDNVIDNLYLKSLNEFVREKYSIYSVILRYKTSITLFTTILHISRMRTFLDRMLDLVEIGCYIFIFYSLDVF